jgi:hypothetical protein
MSIVTAVAGVGICVGITCVIIQYNTPEAQEERRQMEQKEQEWKQEYLRKIMEPIRKKRDKRIFITKFIDEIPELSYYEAAQLKNKLGDIYLEWNDE